MSIDAASLRAAAPAARRPSHRTRRSAVSSVALHSALVFASLVAVFPVFWVLVVSFKPNAKAIESTPTLFNESSLDNYADVLSGSKGAFLSWFGNSVLIAALTTVLGVLMAATTAYAASRFRFPGRHWLLLSFLVVQMFPFAVLIVPLYNILLHLGLQGSVLGLVLVYCSTAIPFATFMLKGYFDSIPTDIDEAGRVDGLSPFGVFWRLVLPLARPGLAVTAFYSFIVAWGEVAFASALLSADDRSKTLAVGLQVFVQQNRTEWGHLAAASVLVAVPAVLVFYLVQRFLVSGLSAGSVKG
ncbi:carbohydrate ABC transporter membrane protein 2 (CUT1 family) [Saccharopolyspora erythraea NRRL 2338]|uniref:Maltose/maltodextrin transport system (Permease) n=2 Tax=Saccharopolyspora erythraea TaxID=1836 RepID=A4FAA8_SACEN|nr:carbohydrate ABC transporter permease [Saccharopolyspora erythraea]EQD86422.1 ABC transporter permease [Saccharopolyspora erythraea D]PFG94769.1 carbohydrate ABC transporter membrane protein 2 (CUT1 family) [Saccharopolyspora erythraea NRRL 2338]QRK91489.1 carbohydrate ABC transporter permease [Saccharopolyspora erythraea]CAM00983.1 maltose/maltodextrin transport system (permease) [Saccharopolyspora erythraea NRRL 2338]